MLCTDYQPPCSTSPGSSTHSLKITVVNPAARECEFNPCCVLFTNLLAAQAQATRHVRYKTIVAAPFVYECKFNPCCLPFTNLLAAQAQAARHILK
jgi:hypothetical protein